METNQPKPKSFWKTLSVVVIVLVIIFGAYFGLAAILRAVNGNDESDSTTTAQKAVKFDQNLVGTWTSDCLVPDLNSPWAEKHQFVINSNGTAVHTRWSSEDHSCNPQGFPGTLVNNYKLSIIKTGTSSDLGQINLLDIDQNATIYDVYQISGDTLLFGHGFRNSLTYDSKTGTSESDRISTLNNYIIYKK